eukprot:CAMPEP_0114614670 /NCGR_PEP_ID=MMETSP0168-20121206/5773_1 /TAXON_ID=95228 ORGANISM="Vannella sp., Strain DIVA3 517/6/12" /NCGR_SAMPLE_ID=MMETSP0168 /ASSEMBLY_ACC=CAM_ASM_000044 /LENGTH=131 /DNA_ID=CAMNT_0001825725 /DNA_START=40 /DNA_END=435 /DNA_ORIENTATION=+
MVCATVHEGRKSARKGVGRHRGRRAGRRSRATRVTSLFTSRPRIHVRLVFALYDLMFGQPSDLGRKGRRRKTRRATAATCEATLPSEIPTYIEASQPSQATGRDASHAHYYPAHSSHRTSPWCRQRTIRGL